MVRKKLKSLAGLFVLVSSFLVLSNPAPSQAAVCVADTAAPYASAGKDVTFRGSGDCASEVKGIRVQIKGWRKNLDHSNHVKIVDKTFTCGGPTYPPGVLSCPIFERWFLPEGNRASGCKYYWSHVSIDVVYGGQAFWSLNQDSTNSNNSLICYSDNP